LPHTFYSNFCPPYFYLFQFCPWHFASFKLVNKTFFQVKKQMLTQSTWNYFSCMIMV
jgi:hypothetical protein